MTFGLACDRDGYDLRFPRPVEATKVDEAWLADLDRTLFGDPPLTVPNRLYGATINEHGEAV